MWREQRQILGWISFLPNYLLLALLLVGCAPLSMQQSSEVPAAAVTERSDANIRRTLDRSFRSVNDLYERAAGSNPGLEGKVVFKLTILPDGMVSIAHIVSSELNHQALEQQLLDRIKKMDFGAQNVAPITTEFGIGFFQP